MTDLFNGKASLIASVSPLNIIWNRIIQIE